LGRKRIRPSSTWPILPLRQQASTRSRPRMNRSLHHEAIIECYVDAAPEVAEWLTDTLRGAVADVLGYEELAGEEAVETSIIEA
jgi:hypothetical protein